MIANAKHGSKSNCFFNLLANVMNEILHLLNKSTFHFIFIIFLVLLVLTPYISFNYFGLIRGSHAFMAIEFQH